MLVLNLTPEKGSGNTEQSSFRIGTDVVVRVLEVSRNQVTVGIEAPKDVVILRESVYQKAISEKITKMRSHK